MKEKMCEACVSFEIFLMKSTYMPYFIDQLRYIDDLIHLNASEFLIGGSVDWDIDWNNGGSKFQINLILYLNGLTLKSCLVASEIQSSSYI